MENFAGEDFFPNNLGGGKTFLADVYFFPHFSQFIYFWVNLRILCVILVKIQGGKLFLEKMGGNFRR